jgi:tyrosine aminotransferase
LHSAGHAEAKAAIAKRYSPAKYPVTSDDVVIASGCSGAIAIVIPTLCNPGDNILVPAPGFSLYRTVCAHYGIECRYYACKPDAGWEIDLDQCKELVDDRTRAILVNNPSNPCGSVFSAAHIKDIIAFAEDVQLPIVADEIYANMVFPGYEFYSFAELSEHVPIISLGGLAKQYLVPGWRVGWVVTHDRDNRLSQIKEGFLKMSMVTLGANSLVQGALPAILNDTKQAYYDDVNALLGELSQFCVQELQKIDGLRVIVPHGAMYAMIQIEVDKLADIKDDMEFCQKLLNEEFVFTLPGSCFQAPNFFRVVTCVPKDLLKTAFERIAEFMERHRK